MVSRPEVGDLLLLENRWRIVTSVETQDLIWLGRPSWRPGNSRFRVAWRRLDVLGVIKGGRFPRFPVIYFVQSGRLVKIGFTENIRGRLNCLRCTHGRVRLLGMVRGRRARERDLHARFAHLRQHGEWFTLTPELRAFITEATT